MGNNGNRPSHYVDHVRPDVLIIPFRLQGKGNAAMVDLDAGQKGTEILSITHTATGVMTIVPLRKYSGAVESISFGSIADADGNTYNLASIDLTAPSIVLHILDKTGSAVDPTNASTLLMTIAVRKRTRN